jgi:hypothetical protein
MLEQELVGTWLLVSNYVEREDGTRLQTFGTDPKGMAVYDASGRFSYMIMGNIRKKFTAGNRMEGTDEENRSVVQGSMSFFGTYAVDEATKTVTWSIERASFPNWDGTSRKISIDIVGDRLHQVAAPIHATGGAYVPHLEWMRAT